MENLAFVGEFCEHLVLQCNQFCRKQHLFGERIRPTDADVKIEVSFGEHKLVKSLFLKNLNSAKVQRSELRKFVLFSLPVTLKRLNVIFSLIAR